MFRICFQVFLFVIMAECKDHFVEQRSKLFNFLNCGQQNIKVKNSDETAENLSANAH